MLDNIESLGHACIRFNKENKVIYVDPFNIKKEYNDADIIFITHSHYDHYSYKDIVKVIKDDTIMVVTTDLYEEVSKYCNAIAVEPNKEYTVSGINFKTVWAYNSDNSFHPKESNWVGYIIRLEGNKYFIAGDTDITEDNKVVRCDVAFVPVGGTYTMNSTQAAKLVNIIGPAVAVPIHYGSIIGNEENALDFIEEVDGGTRIYMMM